MEIKYRQSDGLILEVKSHPTHILTAGAGEALEDYNGPDKPFAGMLRLGQDSIRFKTQQERDDEREAAKTPDQKRLDVLKAKPVLTLQEVTEALKLQGLL